MFQYEPQLDSRTFASREPLPGRLWCRPPVPRSSSLRCFPSLPPTYSPSFDWSPSPSASPYRFPTSTPGTLGLQTDNRYSAIEYLRLAVCLSWSTYYASLTAKLITLQRYNMDDWNHWICGGRAISIINDDSCIRMKTDIVCRPLRHSFLSLWRRCYQDGERQPRERERRSPHCGSVPSQTLHAVQTTRNLHCAILYQRCFTAITHWGRTGQKADLFRLYDPFPRQF